MYHDPRIAPALAERRPVSAVSAGVGWAGLAGLGLWMAAAKWARMDGPLSAPTALIACALPMIGWSLLVDKVHRHASTGIDWSRARPWAETRAISQAKIAGLWLTWAGLAAIYLTARFWWQPPFSLAMRGLMLLAPVLFVASVPYVLWLDRYLVEPRDGAWALGRWAMGQGRPDRAAIAGHLRAWAVKGFFAAFMLAVVPGGFNAWVDADLSRAVRDPALLAMWLVGGMFVVDVIFATVGYFLTARPLDSHIRSANPFAAAWTAALICYPPFIMMDAGRPLDYRPGTADWTWWLAGHPWLLTGWGAVLVALTAIYAWATVAFGLRFSNLTHRGIITHGPYRWSRHPAYLSKNAFWWLSTLPMLSTQGLVEGVRATVLLAAVSGVYWWRAKTEERHLRRDPAYRAYWRWMERHGAVPRLFRWVRGEAA